MHRKPCDHAVNPFAGSGFDSHGLRGVHFIEDRGQAVLWKPLHAQVAVGGDFADDEARLVNGSDDEAMRCAAADGDDYVAEIVRDRVQIFQARANFVRELIFVARDGWRVDKLFKLMRQAGVRAGRFQRLTDGSGRVQEKNRN